MQLSIFLLRLSILFGIFCLLNPYAIAADPPQSEEARQLQALVNRAASLVETKGKEAFSELRKKDSEWWKGELYIFVDGMDGIVLVNPPDPAIEGQNLLNDPAAKPVVELLIDKAKNSGSGWVEYIWPKPGETNPSKKMSYIKQVKMPEGPLVIVGAGMYQP